MLHIARSYPNNVIDTLGMWTAGLVSELAKRHNIRVISPVPYCPPLPDYGPLRHYTRFRAVERTEERDGVRVYHPRFALGPGQTTQRFEHRTYGLAVQRTADNIYPEFGFDLIHAHFVHPDGVAAARLAKRYGVPFLITDQAPWVPWLDRPSVRRVAVPAARQAAALTCVSEYLRGTMRHHLGPNVPIEVIPNGVDADSFAPGDESRRDPNLIAYVGLINFNKGIDVLLEAMTHIARRNARARLVLVGGSYYRNTQLQEERLRRRARELSLDDRVTFAGRQPPAEVARVMRESAVVVLPSRAETFGSVLIEALASGTPVVATRSGGPEDIVTSDVGRLVPVGDPHALADALVAVLSRRDLYEPSKLRRYALDHFRWSIVADAYQRLYAEARGIDGPASNVVNELAQRQA